MRPVQKFFAITVVLLLGATVYGLVRTAEPPKVPPSVGKQPVPVQQVQVDQSAIKTAQQLAQLATTPEERPLAQEALRLADYEVRSEEHTSELQSHSDLVCRLLLEKKK